MSRVRLFRTSAALLLLAIAGASLAQPFPSKPLTLVVPFVPGGQIDTSARIVADPLSKLLGQPVVVENRPGAAGNLAYGLVARAPKDGYTILVGYSGTHVCNPFLYKSLGWDPKDFVPLGMLTVATHVLTVHPSVPANSLNELVAHLKKNPGKLNIASSGLGSLSHIAGAMFQQQTGTEMVHVPYKGSGEVLKDLLSGRVEVYFPTPPSIMQHVKAGNLKALSITSMNRIQSMPDVPTANESGVPGFVVEAWVALFAPAGTPPDVVAKLTNAISKSMDTAESRKRSSDAGIDVQLLAGDALAARVQQDLQACGNTVRSAKISAE